MTKASDNDYPSILLTEQGSAPTSPAASHQRLYIRTSDHGLVTVNSSGTVTAVGGGLTDPMTTRGDLIVRNSSNVTARLARGSASQVLTSDGTDVGWAAPGAGGLALITDTLLGSDTATFDFTSIQGTYKHLQMIVTARSTQAATETWIKMNFNNDTAANYDGIQTQWFASSTSSAFNEDLGATSFPHAIHAAGASSVTGDVGTATLYFPDYASTVLNKFFHAEGYVRLTTGTGQVRRMNTGGNWRSTAAITRITLTPTSGNFKTGCRATLYGLS